MNSPWDWWVRASRRAKVVASCAALAGFLVLVLGPSQIDRLVHPAFAPSAGRVDYDLGYDVARHQLSRGDSRELALERCKANPRATPVVAVILAAVVFAAMLTLAPGSALVATVVSAGALQLVLMIGRGVYLRREGRLADLPVRWHQFAFLWSTFSGGPYLLGGENSMTSAAIYVGTGIFFALVMLGAFWLLDRTVVQR